MGVLIQKYSERNKLSAISLTFKRADCSAEMSLGDKTLSLSQKIRIKILLMKVHKLIGLKSPKVTGPWFLGRKTIRVVANWPNQASTVGNFHLHFGSFRSPEVHFVKMEKIQVIVGK